MEIEQKIKQLEENIISYSDDQLSDLEWEFTRWYAQTSVDLAKTKSKRAEDILDIKSQLIKDTGKFTESGAEQRYYATTEGKWLVKHKILLQAVGRLISTIRSRKQDLPKINR